MTPEEFKAESLAMGYPSAMTPEEILQRPVSNSGYYIAGKRDGLINIKQTITGIPIANVFEQEHAELIVLAVKERAALLAVAEAAEKWHGQKEAKAKREARKMGVPWKIAKREFVKANSL